MSCEKNIVIKAEVSARQARRSVWLLRAGLALKIKQEDFVNV